MAAKQTGPAQPVKRRDRVRPRFGLAGPAGVVLAALAISACASVAWHQAGKSSADERRDLSGCERDAETATLADSGTNRADFPLPNASGAKRGPSPLEFHDRSELSGRYDRAAERCMKAKGYMQGHAADQR